MSAIWKEFEEKIEEKIEEMKEKLPEEHCRDTDILNRILTKGLKEITSGKITATPYIKGSKITEVKYYLPIKPTSKNIGIITGIIANDERVSALDYKKDFRENKIESIVAYKDKEPLGKYFLSLSFYKKDGSKISIYCDDEKEAEIVDEIVKSIVTYKDKEFFKKYFLSFYKKDGSEISIYCDDKKEAEIVDKIVKSIVAYKGQELFGKEPLLSLHKEEGRLFGGKISIYCYKKEASEIVDKIAKKFKLI